MSKVRAHHKVWLVGATFAFGAIAVLVLMQARMGAELVELRSIEQRDIPQQQLLKTVVGELNTTRIALTDAARSSDPSARVALIQDAVNASATAATKWREFEQFDPRLPGERALRARYRQAEAAAKQAGQPAGLAIVNAPPGAPVPASTELDTDLASMDQEIAAASKLEREEIVALERAIVAKRSDMDSARALAPLAVALSLLLGFVVTYLCARSVRRQESTLRHQEEERAESARRNEFDARIGRALDMAKVEEGAFDVIGQALAEVVADDSAELLLADSSRAHFARIIATDPGVEGCGVTTPDDCPAAQRSATLLFPTSAALDACPHLRALGDAASAVCVPVTVGSQAIGVVHVGAPASRPPSTQVIGDIELIARKAGDRVGMIRAFRDSESQARTDPLTGLLNRRSLENRVRDLTASGASYVVAYGDLDQFKDLNDAHGHETGDRSLRLFARVLRDSIRPADIPARFGGEEFLIVLPDCSVDDAVAVMERVREQLALALAGGAVPGFTVSFGVAPGSPNSSFDEVVSEADTALYQAKRAGRNRVARANEPTERDAVVPADVL
jgi:diguanylate cyclase (GGDEF)-like protein